MESIRLSVSSLNNLPIDYLLITCKQPTDMFTVNHLLQTQADYKELIEVRK